MDFDAIVIGGGAAGLFCAIEAGKLGRRTLVIEHNAHVGRKIVISGGGRCNFTNVHTSPENFISSNPHFCKSALTRYTPRDFIELVKKHKIEFYEKKLGQLFCRGRSQQIVDMLLKECRPTNVRVETGCSVVAVRKDVAFTVETTQGAFECESLIIATGGLSFPKIGASNFGYNIARQFGLKIIPTRPSLVPLVFESISGSSKLAGISVDSAVTAGSNTFRENILFTHRGLSGPAILQASNYWTRGEPLEIDLLPDIDARKLLEANRSSKKTLNNFLERYLPDRVAGSIVGIRVPDKPINEMSTKEIAVAARALDSWQVKFARTEGYDKAEVTIGGVSTDELSSQTMESKKVPGLYLIGEVVDVTGWLGGYNFQWAWASGFAAGQAA
jgi:predicted Rossmann fold flavoprotein